MRDIQRTEPAFFWVETRQGNPAIPEGRVWLHRVTIDTVELQGTPEDADKEFLILGGLVVNEANTKGKSPRVRWLSNCLRKLLVHLQENRENF